MRSTANRAVLMLVTAVALAACPGETARRKQDGAADGLHPDGAHCSATGVPTWCNPLEDTGCLAGHCYVIKDQGPSCVCTPGTAQSGEACNTTTDCAAGHVCAGTSPPGVCRKNCDPNIPVCAADEKCTAIQTFYNYGYCEPK